MNENINISKKGLIVVSSLIALAVGWRLINHSYGIAYNLEIVTMVSLLAALRYGWKAGLIVPLVTMALSDAAIGNTSILLFTWGSFALIGLGSTVLRRLNNRRSLQLIASVGYGAAGSLLFFIVTNFGVWLQGYYPPTFEGLMMSYTMAIPFFKPMLIGNLIMLPLAVAAWQTYQAKQAVTKEAYAS